MTSASRSALKTYSPLLMLVVYLYAFNAFSLIAADNDLWGHVKFGGQIWSQGALPETDPYSYTAHGEPWHNHEWLTEVLFYLIYDAFDSTGLLVFKLAVGLAIVAILSRLVRAKESNVFALWGFWMLAIPVMAPGFMTRPQLMTYLFLTLLWFLLHQFFEGRRGAMALSPILMMLWANCHGGVVAGMGIFGTVAGIAFLRSFFHRNPPVQDRWLLFWFALSCGAVLVNPDGWKLWEFFYHSLRTPRMISEWNPVPLATTRFWEFKALALLFAASLLVPGKKRLWEVVVIAAALIYGFRHQRHIVLAAIVMAPYLPLQLARLVRALDAPSLARGLSPAFHRVVQAGLLLFAGFQAVDGVSKYASNDFRILVEPGIYPSYAVRFMKENDVNGNLLVPFDWGEYVLWHLPESKVSIDGRFRTVYPEQVIRENRAFRAGETGWRILLEDYPTDIIMVRRPDGTDQLLEDEPGWVLFYNDPLTSLYVRKTNPPGPVERKLYNRQFTRNESPPDTTFP